MSPIFRGCPCPRFGLAMLLVVATGSNVAKGSETRTDPVGDSLPPGAVARMGKKQLPGGEDRVNVVGFVALSPDGKTLASTGGAVGSFPTILWETATGKELARITGPGREGYMLAFSADGKFLLSLVSSAILFFDPATTKELHRINLPGGSPYVSFALSADGASVVYAAGGRDATTRKGQHLSGFVKVTRVELATHKELGQFRGDDGKGVLDFALSSDGKTLFVQTSKDQKVHLWDTARGKERSTFARPKGTVLVFSPDAGLMAWQQPGEEGTIRLGETTAGKELRQLVLAKQAPRYVGGHRNAAPVFSPDSKKLAATLGKTTLVWDVATGKELKRFQGDQVVVMAMGFSGDGNILATGGDDGTVLIWKVREERK